jgi:hypothetical protein
MLSYFISVPHLSSVRPKDPAPHRRASFIQPVSAAQQLRQGVITASVTTDHVVTRNRSRLSRMAKKRTVPKNKPHTKQAIEARPSPASPHEDRDLQHQQRQQTSANPPALAKAVQA